MVIEKVELPIISCGIVRAMRRSDGFRLGHTEQPEQQILKNDGLKESTYFNSRVSRRLKLTRGLLMVIVTCSVIMLPLSIAQVLSIPFLRHPTCVCMVEFITCFYMVAL
ncbi:unnamed protein product [Dibothriocephalus latus]|uniref:Uncharacterized protein n=1 Tax=Dibothriocephalus latus TaxID=60516 RepID=A0A3P7L9I0_DIBLA|nr:unnamed protein product [Dibothriocephalus latus]